MGVHTNITLSTFPRQGSFLGKDVKVYFHYDTSTSIPGTVIRDDAEDPFRTIILLSDGRVILATECQFQPY